METSSLFHVCFSSVFRQRSRDFIRGNSKVVEYECYLFIRYTEHEDNASFQIVHISIPAIEKVRKSFKAGWCFFYEELCRLCYKKFARWLDEINRSLFIRFSF